MTKWLEQNVWLAAWLSVLIAAVSMFIQKIKSTTPIKWNSVVLRLALLICLASAITPGVDHDMRYGMLGLAAVWGGAIMMRPE